jgi:GGDEF domain-containing protein
MLTFSNISSAIFKPQDNSTYLPLTENTSPAQRERAKPAVSWRRRIDLSLPEEAFLGDLSNALASLKKRALQAAAYVEASIPGGRCEIVIWDFEHQIEALLAPDPQAGGAIRIARRRHVCSWQSRHGSVGALRVHVFGDRWLTDEDINLIDDVSTQLRQIARELAAETLLRLDPLTTILNFSAFRQAAEKELERCMSREGVWKPAAFLFLDMDGLKAFNNVFDYDLGDDAICRTARILVRAQRSRGTVCN